MRIYTNSKLKNFKILWKLEKPLILILLRTDMEVEPWFYLCWELTFLYIFFRYWNVTWNWFGNMKLTMQGAEMEPCGLNCVGNSCKTMVLYVLGIGIWYHCIIYVGTWEETWLFSVQGTGMKPLMFAGSLLLTSVIYLILFVSKSECE